MSLLGRTQVAVLQTLLTTLGMCMVAASRGTDRFRRQVTVDVIVEVRSEDGAREQYQFHRATRRLTLPRPLVDTADCILIFPTAWEGVRTLISAHTIGHLVQGMNYGNTQVVGNPVILLWFHGLTRIVAPIGSTRRPRRRQRKAVPVREPELRAPWAKSIVREAPVSQLSHDWPEAWRARATLWQLRAPAGERIPKG
jgi:hypothetical protein